MFYNSQENDILFECAGKMVLASYKERMVLPFEPLVFSFNDVNYFIDVPQVIILHRLLFFFLSTISGFKRPIISLLALNFFLTRKWEANA